MALTITPTELQIRTALRGFLVSVLPTGVDVILGQENRVPEPATPSFAVIWPLRRLRLATNLHTFSDCFFDGEITGTSMVVGTVEGLPLAPGRQVFGPGVAANTVIVSGPGGGAGTYVVAPSQNVPDAILSAGAATFTMQGSKIYQIDVHSAPPNVGPDASDMATTISTMFRDPYATEYFAATEYPLAPITADDGRQMPFTNAEEQFETRWVVECTMQANQTVAGVPAEFADSATFSSVNVDEAFPP